jgi:hypothetical protein
VTSGEVYDNFEKYIKLYEDTFKFPK